MQGAEFKRKLLEENNILTYKHGYGAVAQRLEAEMSTRDSTNGSIRIFEIEYFDNNCI